MKKKVKRPLLITIICILGFMGIPLQIFGLSSIADVIIPSWYSILNVLFALAYLVGLIFIWKMKKWGLILYTSLAIVEGTIMFSLDIANTASLGISVILLAVLWTLSKDMT